MCEPRNRTKQTEKQIRITWQQATAPSTTRVPQFEVVFPQCSVVLNYPWGWNFLFFPEFVISCGPPCQFRKDTSTMLRSNIRFALTKTFHLLLLELGCLWRSKSDSMRIILGCCLSEGVNMAAVCSIGHAAFLLDYSFPPRAEKMESSNC